MSDPEQLPTGNHPVCPRCGTAASGRLWCPQCGLNLRQAQKLPSADAYAAQRRGQQWAAEREARVLEDAERRREETASRQEMEHKEREREREQRKAERRAARAARKKPGASRFRSSLHLLRSRRVLVMFAVVVAAAAIFAALVMQSRGTGHGSEGTRTVGHPGAQSGTRSKAGAPEGSGSTPRSGSYTATRAQVRALTTAANAHHTCGFDVRNSYLGKVRATYGGWAFAESKLANPAHQGNCAIWFHRIGKSWHVVQYGSTARGLPATAISELDR